MKPTIKFEEGGDVAVLTCTQEDMLYVMSLMTYTHGKRFDSCLEEHDDLIEQVCYNLYEQVIDIVEIIDSGRAFQPIVALKEVSKLRV